MDGSLPFQPNTMKNLRVLPAVLCLTALASTASGARFYAQPSIAFAALDTFKTSTGPALALGATFRDKHSVEIEGSRFEPEDTYGIDFELTVTPVLLNYSYRFPIAENFSGAVGLSAGLVMLEADYTAYGYTSFPFESYTYREHAEDDAFAAGFHAGVSYQLSEHFSLTARAKALRMDKSLVLATYSTFLIFQLGVNCRF
jgi:long-subunit fatty acid transport protein